MNVEHTIKHLLKEAIDQAMKDIEALSQQNQAVTVVEGSATVIDEQPHALPAPIVCHETAKQMETWSEEKKEAFSQMIQAAYAMVEGEQQKSRKDNSHASIS